MLPFLSFIFFSWLPLYFSAIYYQPSLKSIWRGNTTSSLPIHYSISFSLALAPDESTEKYLLRLPMTYVRCHETRIIYRFPVIFTETLKNITSKNHLLLFGTVFLFISITSLFQISFFFSLLSLLLVPFSSLPLDLQLYISKVLGFIL